MTKRDNSTIEYTSEKRVNNRFGWVQFFVFYENKTLVFVQQQECQQFNAKACILSVSSKDEMEVIRIDKIVSNCMFVIERDLCADFRTD